MLLFRQIGSSSLKLYLSMILGLILTLSEPACLVSWHQSSVIFPDFCGMSPSASALLVATTGCAEFVP